MLENSAARTPSRESTRDWGILAIRPFPSRYGWIITRLRWAIAAQTMTGVEPGWFKLSIRSSMRPGTRSASGPSYTIWPDGSCSTNTGPERSPG